MNTEQTLQERIDALNTLVDNMHGLYAQLEHGLHGVYNELNTLYNQLPDEESEGFTSAGNGATAHQFACKPGATARLPAGDDCEDYDWDDREQEPDYDNEPEPQPGPEPDKRDTATWTNEAELIALMFPTNTVVTVETWDSPNPTYCRGAGYVGHFHNRGTVKVFRQDYSFGALWDYVRMNIDGCVPERGYAHGYNLTVAEVRVVTDYMENLEDCRTKHIYVVDDGVSYGVVAVARCVEDVIAIYNEEFPYSPHTQTEELGTAWWKIPDGPVLFAR